MVTKVVVTKKYAQKPSPKSEVLARAEKAAQVSQDPKVKDYNQKLAEKLISEGKVLAEKVEAKKQMVQKVAPKAAPKKVEKASKWTPEAKAAFHEKMVAAREAKNGSSKPTPKAEKLAPKAPVSAPKTSIHGTQTLATPEHKFLDLVSEVRVLEEEMAFLKGQVGKFTKFLSYLSTFDSNALRVEPTPSTNGVEKVEKKVSSKPKKIWTEEERAAIRVRFLKGQAKAQAKRDLGDKFSEAKFEKSWLKAHPES